MRGLLLGVAFFALLPLIFFVSPYIGVLMWFWVSLMSPQKIVWSSIFSNVNFALIVAISTLLCWLFTREEARFPPFTKTTILLVLLMVWVSVTSLFGIGPPAQIYMWWEISEKMLLMTLLAYAWTNTRERLDWLILVCVLSVAFYGVRGGLGTILRGGGGRVFGPDDTMIGDNNDLGVALTMMLPVLLYLRQRYQHKWYLKAFFLITISLTVVGDLFTYSRGALVALCAMTLILWVRSRQKILISLFVGASVVGLLQFAPSDWFARMSTIETYQEDESAESRLYMWQMSWELALRRPILGGGFHWGYEPETINRELATTGLPPLTRPRAPHSNWFEMLGSHGFPGLLLFVAILIGALLDARWLTRHSRDLPELQWADNLGRMTQAGLIGYAAGGSFATLGMYDGFYALVIIVACARRIVARQVLDATVRPITPERRTGRARHSGRLPEESVTAYSRRSVYRAKEIADAPGGTTRRPMKPPLGVRF